MGVKRIVPNFELFDPKVAKSFYEDIFGLRLVMDQGWIATFAADASAQPQVSLANEGGSGTPVPDASIEVDNVDETYRKARAAGCEIVYELCDEPWGVRRFYVRDPAGRILNVLAHKGG